MLKVARHEQQQALIALCGMGGLRISEALKVVPSDFDLVEMSLTVHGKGNKLRKVPVTEEAWSYICSAVARAFVDGDRPLIQFKDRFARATVTNLARRAKLMRRVASHDLRATFATALYDQTQDQRLVQEVLGHAHGTTTEIYILASMDRAREAMAKL
jgi:integrase